MSARRYAVLAALCFLWGAVSEIERAGGRIPPIPAWAHAPAYWWHTPDQRGHDAFVEGDWARARQHFLAPTWRAAACYRAGDLDCAAQAYLRATAPSGTYADTPADTTAAHRALGHYNLGNTEARRGRFLQAVKHYDAALAEPMENPRVDASDPSFAAHPGRPMAQEHRQRVRENRQRVLALIAERTRRNEPPDGDGDPGQPPDQVTQDERGDRGKPGRIEIEKLDTRTLAALWLRQLSDDPGAFLRLRFADEAQRAAESAPATRPTAPAAKRGTP